MIPANIDLAMKALDSRIRLLSKIEYPKDGMIIFVSPDIFDGLVKARYTKKPRLGECAEIKNIKVLFFMEKQNYCELFLNSLNVVSQL